MNKKETETITVPHFEGYKCVGYKIPKKGQYYLYLKEQLHMAPYDMDTIWLVYEKLQPKRYIFEATDEFRVPQKGEWFLYDANTIYKSDGFWNYDHRIIKQIHE